MRYTQTFHVRLHSGWQGEIETNTGIYRDAAAAVPAILGIGLPVDLEIWSATPQIQDKRFHYRVRENEFGQLLVEQLVSTADGQ